MTAVAVKVLLIGCETCLHYYQTKRFSNSLCLQAPEEETYSMMIWIKPKKKKKKFEAKIVVFFFK